MNGLPDKATFRIGEVAEYFERREAITRLQEIFGFTRDEATRAVSSPAFRDVMIRRTFRKELLRLDNKYCISGLYQQIGHEFSLSADSVKKICAGISFDISEIHSENLS